MIIQWTAHLQDPEERARFEREVKGARPVLERLLQLIDEDEAALSRKEMDSNVYSLPGWDYRQADANGYRRCLKNYKQLLNLDPRLIQVKTND